MQGCKVFPTNPNTKRPCIKDPFGRAVNSREEVIDLFKDFPGAGIGVPTGPSNGITVVDIDIKNGVDGWFNLGALEIEIPITAVVHTPSGGFHLYYDTGNIEIQNSVSDVAQGVDIRGAGGYVQGPGTVVNLVGTVGICSIVLLSENFQKCHGLLRHCMGANLEDAYLTGWKRSPVRESFEANREGMRNNKMASRIGYLIKSLNQLGKRSTY